MWRSFLVNLKVGVFEWALFHLVLSVLVVLSGSEFSSRPQLLPILAVALTVVALIMAPLNRYFARCPRCGILLVGLMQGYFGALAMGLYTEPQLTTLRSLLMAPLGVFLYTFPYVLVIAGLTVVAFRKQFTSVNI